MWYEQPQELPDGKDPGEYFPSIRHWCDENDDLIYGWLKHDGVNFGIQRIIEKNFTFNTSFVKKPGGFHGGDWTARITADSKREEEPVIVSFLMYVALDGQGELTAHLDSTKLEYIQGETNELDKFRISFSKVKRSENFKYHYLSTQAPSLQNLKSIVTRNLVKDYMENKIFVLKNLQTNDKPNFVVHQVTAELPFEIEIIFESGSFRFYDKVLKDNVYSEELEKYAKEFDTRFSKIFQLKSKRYKTDDINFAKETLSNMLGGISYFYGESLVKSVQNSSLIERIRSHFDRKSLVQPSHNNTPVLYGPAPLFTSITSKTIPRGILWSVGFDNLLIHLWNQTITKEIISHWLNLMNVEGWIPPVQALGIEAQARIGEIIQHNNIANPPTIFLVIEKFLSDSSNSMTLFLEKIYPRLEKWFNWLHESQKSRKPTTYYWRGRNKTTKIELIPQTPASGLDDYPRPSHPSEDERHVDLRCWMELVSRVVADVGQRVGENTDTYRKISENLHDNDLLKKYHWNAEQDFFSDYGSHTNSLELDQNNLERIVFVDPKPQFVETFGYVSLYPLMLKTLEPGSSHLRDSLLDITKKELLWTEFGLRSLSKHSPFYQTKNTKFGIPHWRGSIWIHMNYLTLSSLYHYAKIPGQHRSLARSIYKELRINIVNNVIRQQRKTGFVYEQYDDTTGEGKGTYPCNGWCSPVVNIMAENY
ncbi:mannosyl-oligosaccharide glucosidase-like [Saccostrea echinata]|uniref:mannosyl-oligosaccharide glucosidase-like n=1 Tax=Saccostrea echinata TaxID=191078 RepID=UPI002A82E25B|nr:mannosyl-oligosaccharide glucosidase-like [Saccostrea echinata]